MELPAATNDDVIEEEILENLYRNNPDAMAAARIKPDVIFHKDR